MATRTFVDLVGDEQQFFAEYFNKKPMLRKNALGSPRDLLSMARLDELVNLEVIRPPYIKVNLNGDGVPERGYTRNVVVQGTTITDVVDPEKIYDLYKAGATVTWCSLNQIVPEMREFIRVISDHTAVRTDSVAFLTPAGKKGYPPHHDPVDLFIVQLEGTKYWKLWNPPAKRLGDNEQYTLEGLGEPVIDVLMEPGDVLYLPYGTPHAAEAQDKASLHLSIMMRPRMWKDLLVQTVERLVADGEFDEYPHVGAFRDARVAATFAEKAAMLADRLRLVGIEAELDRHAHVGRTQPGSSSGDTFATITATEDIGPDVLLRRTAVTIDVGPSKNGRTQLTVGGNKIAVPTALADGLIGLGTTGSITAAMLVPGADAARSTKAARGLTKLGVLEVAAV